MKPEDVLEFWYGTPGPAGAIDAAHVLRWWKKDPKFDQTIREQFGATHEAAAASQLGGWAASPRGRLALTIVLDQFSRNLFRDDPRAFAQDERAVELCQAAIRSEEHRDLAPYERVFQYMPLMHSEDLALQEQSVALYTALVDDAPTALREGLRGNVDFAVRHRDIVARFGRFPHRNRIVGRDSTPTEVAFLQGPNSSF